METNNLPQYTTPLIGRGVEMADIGARLGNPHCRLLTLVGPGGSGKTRLAIEAASEQAQVFQDGVFFVALQPVESVRNIVLTVGSAIGYEFSAGSEPALQLQHHLHEKDTLLILDNMEHLLDAAGLIIKLLMATSRLRLLVTSREALHLQDEWLYHIEGLPFPELESTNEIESYGAVQLFANHAHRVRRNFSLQEEHETVNRICRLVEGMPLGIELAASWLRRLPSAEIARELEKSLDILQADLHDVPDRHRSMRAVFDHSWNLLSDEERRTFMALSVFRGGCRREGAEEIAGATLSVLMSLVDKSMLKVSRSGRYEIHELQRQYAAERLEELPDLEMAVRDQHSAYYTRFINRPISEFVRAGNQQTLGGIDDEIDNIRSAWDWAITQQNVDNLRQALQGIYWYAWLRSWHEEGERAFREVVAVLRSVEPTDKNRIALGEALNHLAAMNIWLGHPVEAGKLTRESIAILRPLDARYSLALALGVHGWAAYAQQDWRRANALLEEAAILYEETDQNELRAFVYSQLGDIASVEGDYKYAEQWYQQALRLGRQIGDQRSITQGLLNLGNLARWQGQYPRARQLYEKGLAIARAAEINPFIFSALRRLGTTAKMTGELETAREYIEESRLVAKADGKGPAIAWGHIFLADVMIAQGEHEAAQNHLKKALDIPPGMANRDRYAAVQAGWGHIALQTGAYSEAREHFEASCALYREIQDDSGIITNLVLMARAALAQDEEDQAAEFLLEALQRAIKNGSPPNMLQVIAGIAGLFVTQGNLTDAIRLAALVAQHPASSAESKELAEMLLNTPQASLTSVKRSRVSGLGKHTNLNKLGEQLVKQLLSQPGQSLIEALSERELEVLQLVAAGRSNREIAGELFLAVGTVKSHLHNILQKLDASSRTQAVARARDLHLL